MLFRSNKRVEWKNTQYTNQEKEQIKENIIKRDEMQKQNGYYDKFKDTITIDVSNCANIEESTKQVLEHILEYREAIQNGIYQ